jgi:hypothetical protein
MIQIVALKSIGEAEPRGDLAGMLIDAVEMAGLVHLR